ncbi:hypothetical protein LWI29_009648 [Acer saccharum]|uniref:Uncharacterized protein n=1 Tax=Acer saccharum TaxID=4024 RepID=A0AA39RGT0_ACESA|nr:hypothetical protein LWI29_009648 [Acer saccharum]
MVMMMMILKLAVDGDGDDDSRVDSGVCEMVAVVVMMMMILKLAVDGGGGGDDSGAKMEDFMRLCLAIESIIRGRSVIVVVPSLSLRYCSLEQKKARLGTDHTKLWK